MNKILNLLSVFGFSTSAFSIASNNLVNNYKQNSSVDIIDLSQVKIKKDSHIYQNIHYPTSIWLNNYLVFLQTLLDIKQSAADDNSKNILDYVINSFKRESSHWIFEDESKFIDWSHEASGDDYNTNFVFSYSGKDSRFINSITIENVTFQEFAPKGKKVTDLLPNMPAPIYGKDTNLGNIKEDYFKDFKNYEDAIFSKILNMPKYSKLKTVIKREDFDVWFFDNSAILTPIPGTEWVDIVQFHFNINYNFKNNIYKLNDLKVSCYNSTQNFQQQKMIIISNPLITSYYRGSTDNLLEYKIKADIYDDHLNNDNIIFDAKPGITTKVFGNTTLNQNTGNPSLFTIDKFDYSETNTMSISIIATSEFINNKLVITIKEQIKAYASAINTKWKKAEINNFSISDINITNSSK